MLIITRNHCRTGKQKCRDGKNDYPNSILHNGLKHKTTGNEATVAGDADCGDGTKRI